MSQFNNLISGFILALIPWANILIVFCDNLKNGNNRKLIAPSMMLIVEFFLSMYIVKEKLYYDKAWLTTLIVVLIPMAIYSFWYFLRNPQIETLKCVCVAFITPIFTAWIFIINIIGLYLSSKWDTRLSKWKIVHLVAIIIAVYTIITVKRVGTDNVSNFTIYLYLVVTTWVTILSMYLRGSLSKPINVQQPTTELAKEDVPEAQVKQTNIGKEQPHNTIQQTRERPNQPAPYDKGWTTDDTVRMEINALIIEDIITPIPLKNEYEKSATELVAHIRKLKRQKNLDTIKNDFPDYLKNYFNATNFEAIRLVYLRSIYVLLEDYSKDDPRISLYAQQISTMINSRHKPRYRI